MKKDELSSKDIQGVKMPDDYKNGRSTKETNVVQVHSKGGELATRSSFAASPISMMREPRILSPEELDARKIIYPDMKDRDVVDSFRELRTKLIKIGGSNNFITMVSSTSPKGGASYVALNLAAAFAFDHSKTALLIDCNLREPRIHSYLGLEPDFGVTDHLEDPSVTIDKIIYSSGIPRLRVIPVGKQRESSSEFFTSLRMREFLIAVQRRYPDRYIVIDAPHVGGGASPDASILSDLCDQIVLVVPHGGVTAAQVVDAASAVSQEKIAGVVVNN